MSFKTVSAILGSNWLIDKSWTEKHLPLIIGLLKGQQVNFDFKKDEDTSLQKALSHYAGSAYNVRVYSDLSSLPQGSIAVMTIAGPILKYGGMCSYGTVDYTQLVNRLANSPNIEGIIINMDTPGGQAAGTAAFADAIKAASSVKPVVSYIDDGIAASAGMWIASAASEIYVSQPHSMVGSVGVYTTLVDWYSYFEQEGLKVKDVYAPQSTDKNQDYIQALAGKEDLLKAELKVLADQFISTVKENRAGKLTSDEWNGGKMFYADDAQRIGLIDGIKSSGELINHMNGLIGTGKKSRSPQQASQQTNNTMSFPKLKAFLGFKSEDNTSDVKLEEKAESLEALVAERDNLQGTVKQHEGTIATLKDEATTAAATIAANTKTIEQLQEDKTALTTKVAALEKGDGTEFSSTSKEKDDIDAPDSDDEFLTSYDLEAKAINDQFK